MLNLKDVTKKMQEGGEAFQTMTALKKFFKKGNVYIYFFKWILKYGLYFGCLDNPIFGGHHF